MPAAATAKKKAPTLPPRPALFTEDEWACAHSVPRLLEVLAGTDKGGGGAAAVCSKAKAALWLGHLLDADADAKEEAIRAKAVEVLAKLLTSAGTAADSALSTHLLGCLHALATPAAAGDEAQAAQAVCEAVLAAKPPLVPWLLKQLEQAAAGVVAAALGLLHALLSCAQTRPLVAKIVSGWNQQPLVAALTSQQSLPLLGGRNGSAHAAGIIQLLCTPPSLDASAGTSSSASTKAAKDGGKQSRTASATSTKSSSASSGSGAAGGGAGDATLATALQQGVLAAGGLPALLKVCTASGSTAGCRASAVTALCHILASHGHRPAVKQEFVSANGLSTVVQVLSRPALPLAARAAAAGCVRYFLMPQGGGSSVSPPEPAQHKGLGLLQQTLVSAQAMLPASMPSSRPGTSHSATQSIIKQALQQRRQQHHQQQHADEAGTLDGASRPTTGSTSGATTTRCSTSSSSGGAAAGAGAWSDAGAAGSWRPSTAAGSGGGSVGLQLPPAPGDAAAAAVAAQHEALLVKWDAAARKGLAVCAEQVVAAGAIPGLLLLCCGPKGVPAGLEAAAATPAAAVATAAHLAQRPGSSSNSSSGNGGSQTAADEQESQPPASSDIKPPVAAVLAGRRLIGSAGGVGTQAAGETLDSLAEGDDAAAACSSATSLGDADSADDSSRINSPGSAARDGSSGSSGGGGAKAGSKAGKKGKKGKASTKLDPDMVAAMEQASAAVNLLALSGDAARGALLSAGALPVLLALLDGSAAAPRWNARQALLSLSLVATWHTAVAALSTSSSGGTAASQPLPAAAAVKLPCYISLSNMPASHWQPVVPPSMPPQPLSIPGRSNRSEGSGMSGGGSSTAGRPGSQGRRASVSNLPGTQASRMSSSTSSFVDGAGGGATLPGGAGGRASMVTRGP